MKTPRKKKVIETVGVEVPPAPPASTQGVVGHPIGAKGLVTVDRLVVSTLLALSTEKFRGQLVNTAAVWIEPFGMTDGEVEAFGNIVREIGIAVRVLPRRKAAVLPDAVVEKAVKRNIRAVCGELAAGANVSGPVRQALEEILDAKLTGVGL